MMVFGLPSEVGLLVTRQVAEQHGERTMSLRRSVFGTQEAPNGEPLRRSAQLLRIPQLRSAYLKVVSELMALRFIQYPILTRRLVALTATVNPAEDFGAMVNSSLSEWLLAPVHY